jgi:hypothetical protein
MSASDSASRPTDLGARLQATTLRFGGGRHRRRNRAFKIQAVIPECVRSAIATIQRALDWLGTDMPI